MSTDLVWEVNPALEEYGTGPAYILPLLDVLCLVIFTMRSANERCVEKQQVLTTLQVLTDVTDAVFLALHNKVQVRKFSW